MGFDVEIRGDREAVAALDRGIAQATEEINSFAPRAGQVAREAFGRQFLRAGAEFGSPWRSLQPSTIAAKDRLGYPGSRILIRTGNLMATVARARDQRGPGAVELLAEVATRRGGSLVELHELAGRQVRHPVTGIAGPALEQLEREWDAAGERVAVEVER